MYFCFFKFLLRITCILCTSHYFFSCTSKRKEEKIDRFALVTRHNVVLKNADTLGALSVGNGAFAFTVDVTGLQTFPAEYENGIPLGTQSEWAWHRMPSTASYTLHDVTKEFESCDNTKAPYAIQQSQGRAGEATQSLRANPHRLHLGLIGLSLLKEDGTEVKLNELTNIKQELDLWTGKIESKYEVEGNPVKIILYGQQHEDGIAVKIVSPLLAKGRLKIKFSFPYGKDCHVCPGYDWVNPEKHHSSLMPSQSHQALIKRSLDTTVYYTKIKWEGTGRVSQQPNPHIFMLLPAQEDSTFKFAASFSPDSVFNTQDFDSIEQSSQEQWKLFWASGGAVDFSSCTDSRASELERRVILSQYLTRIQCAGSMPPQETGLTMNSWYGKFHLEMHWWHATHFALWNRAPLMEKSLHWYATVMEKAKATARDQGYKGARWQKMTDPFGDESPSSVGAFIIWQQPHPIYLSELVYRSAPNKNTLNAYSDIVFNTADFMASFVKIRDGKFHLCHPLIPAQEIFVATETNDPTYELQYWYYGLVTAQQWRRRLGLPDDETWKEVIANLSPLAIRNNLYLPVATAPTAYDGENFRRDHPSVVGALGFLPLNNRVDTTIMLNTLHNIMNNWQWKTTWGWDYPLLAMTAARLNKPELAMEALLMDVQKNTYLVNGHNYQDQRLRLYLPGNGGLLAAVAMMAAGWDGNTRASPGFPKNNKWNVRWEGLQAMP